MSAVQSNKKESAIKLRLQGKSYGEILKILNIPSKGTLSLWFKNIKLSNAAKNRLQKNIDIAREKGLFNFNKERTQKIIKENKSITEYNKMTVGTISKRELMLIGAALYWAEGTTRERENRYSIAAFSNSDSRMAKIFMEYLREIILVPEEKIHFEIHTHPNISKDDAINFWSKELMANKDRFKVYMKISKASKFIRPKNFLPYGTVNIRVRDRRIFYKIKGQIDGLIEG